ncbi:MAG TPA: oxygenase MpaB family protein [Streptosporangiaceae bacterium]|nr:oxygenase MpaB family protein [Streptosporangiaceae bacterium]
MTKQLVPRIATLATAVPGLSFGQSEMFGKFFRHLFEGVPSAEPVFWNSVIEGAVTADAVPADAATPDTAVTDHGLFGPGSVTWRIMNEPVMWVGGFRALYLQALHPRVMHSTWQNTAFTDRKKAFGRFLRTIEFVSVRTYGSTADAQRAGRRVRKIHASLRGTDPDGTTFRLDEPELLLWVHCAEVGSYVDIARRSGVPVSAADLDTFVAEQQRSAALVGLDPATVPGSRAELDAYFADMRPRLRAGPEARQALLTLYNPPVPHSLLPLRVALPPFSVLAFATLPRWARRMYGIPGTPATDLAATAALGAARRASTGLAGRLICEPALRRIFSAAWSYKDSRTCGVTAAVA